MWPDIPKDDQFRPIVVLSPIFKWLERVVLPGQEILVDAPHLISRFPSLLTCDTPDINDWNQADWQDAPANLPAYREPLHHLSIEAHWPASPARLATKWKNQ